MKRLLFLIFLLFSLSVSCGKSDNSPCKGVDCSGHGNCDDSSGRAVCFCDEGYLQSGVLECVEVGDPCAGIECKEWEECVNGLCFALDGRCGDDSDCVGTSRCDTAAHKCVGPCDLVDCGGNGKCVEAGYGSGYGGGNSYQSGVYCECYEGFVQQIQDDIPTCVSEGDGEPPDSDIPEGGDLCYGVTCGGYGVCEIANDGEPFCNCFDGYVADGLNCVVDECADVTCEEWEYCSEGDCLLSEGRCVANDDCSDGATVCDLSTYKCVEDLCAAIDCGNGGVCSVENGAALCNCPNGFYDEGTSCVEIASTRPDWIGVAWPYNISLFLNDEPEFVYGQIYMGDASTGNSIDEHPNWRAQLGYKKGATIAEYPIIPATWTWVPAKFNSKYDGLNNHEYMAEFPTDKVGKFAYIYRFSLDGGASWWYCDKGEPENNGGGNFITSALNHPGFAEIKAVPKVLLKLKDFTKGADSYSFKLLYLGSTPINLEESVVTLNGISAKDSFVYDESTKTFTISEENLEPNKYSWLFRLQDVSGNKIDPFFAPIWIGEGSDFADFGWRDAFIYQLMTDRFLNGDASNDIGDLAGIVVDLEQWKGGDFRGIIQKIEENYFSDMGVNALWISSPVLNPHTTSKGGTSPSQSDVYFTSYHAYHPVATGYSFDYDLGYENDGIDSAFGSSGELRELVEKAHKRGIRVIPDFVANHVHSSSKLYQEHKNEWFYPYVSCADGNNWNDRRIDCWFTKYMPDFNYAKNPDARETVINHAIWLIQEYNLDGFRADALKHIDDVFIKELRSAIVKKIETTVSVHDMPDEAETFYMVGESLGGWARYHTRADMVQGQVDEEYYNKVKNYLFYGNGNISDFANWAVDNDVSYLIEKSTNGGSGGFPGAVMGNFFGNHDQNRALTECGGDYDKLKLAQTFLMTSPVNIPMLYQGDEIGMYGAQENGFDGGRRAVMKFSSLTSDEANALNHMKKLGKFRKKYSALRRGRRSTCSASNDAWLYKVVYEDETVIVGLNRGDSAYDGNCAGVGGTFESYDGSSVFIKEGSVTIPPNGSLIIGKK